MDCDYCNAKQREINRLRAEVRRLCLPQKDDILLSINGVDFGVCAYSIDEDDNRIYITADEFRPIATRHLSMGSL